MNNNYDYKKNIYIYIVSNTIIYTLNHNIYYNIV